MNAKGNCYDLACAKSFFGSLNLESILGDKFNTREEMRQIVFEYIAIDYHRHTANGNRYDPIKLPLNSDTNRHGRR